MIVDTSALVAIAKDEPAKERLMRAVLTDQGQPLISAANALEAAIVIDSRREPVMSRKLDEIRDGLGIAIAPVTATQVDIARQAYRDFGRGSGHPARLNFGDCFAYALAIDSGEPLLWVGDDFVHTGIAAALPSD